mgnify:FL=1
MSGNGNGNAINEVSVDCPAKTNLTLHVGAPRSEWGGRHELDTIYCAVGVYDTVLGNAKQAIEDNRLDAMKTFVGDGQIGSLLMAGMRHCNAQASTSYYGTDNVINDTLIHNFDVLHYMFDGDITSVEMKFARMNTLNPNGEPLREPQLAIVEFSDGALATA